MTLAERIQVNTRYTRSINVERDRGSTAIVDTYLPTFRSVDLLDTVSIAFEPRDQPRAWSLVGPYGSGKSSFALFLHELLGPPSPTKTAAVKALAKARPELARIFDREDGWCRVVLTGSEEPFSSRFLAALDEAATNFWRGKRGRKPTVLEVIRRLRKSSKTSDSDILNVVDFLHGAIEQNGVGGLLIVIDELGKFLEYEAQHGGSGIFLLQQIAERAFRGRNTNLLFFVMLHQGFDLYARGMGERLKNDWAKMQGRFESVSFIESPEQTLHIVSAAFSNSLSESQLEPIHKSASRIAKALARSKALPSNLDLCTAEHIFASCYPIHPISLLALPQLCQRFAQNERTLFSYLGSREPHGFLNSLAALSKYGDWIPPSQIYDYFIHNHPAVLADPLTHRRWAEVVSAVERVEHFDDQSYSHSMADPPTVTLAKTIGLLNLISQSHGLKASNDVLRQLFRTKRAFSETIQSLLDSSIVQYRRFSGEYRVWQGTDFNIDERIEEEKNKRGEFDLTEILSQRDIATPILARRHAVRTGSIRYFDITFVGTNSKPIVPATKTDRPRLVFFLAETREDEENFKKVVSTAGPNEIWALQKNTTLIRTAVSDVLALEGVQQSGQELAADPVASREVRERLQAAQLTEKQLLNELLSNPGSSEWHWRTKQLVVKNHRNLQQMLSNVMDKVYGKAPVILNELINRDRLSSQAAAARNSLFQCMLNAQEQANLNIQKYPPELSIYRSVLEAGHLHTNSNSGWKFTEPDAEDPLNFKPLWTRLTELFAESEAQPITLDRFMSELTKPPFGVKRGIFPVIFLHYYLIHRFEIALYDEGTYAPTLVYEHLERMVRRPDLFSFQRLRIEGVRATLFEEYSRALFGEVRDSMNVLDLARPLTQFVLGLDEYTQKTRRLSETTIRIRQAFYLSKTPAKFLFSDLPEACGFKDTTNLAGFAEKLVEALRELKGARAALYEFMRLALCSSFGLNRSLPIGELRSELSTKYSGLDQYTLDVQGLRSFIRRLCESDPTDDHWFDSILLFLGHKPTEKWLDQDRDTAEYRLIEFSQRLLELEKLRLHMGAKSSQTPGQEVILLKTVSNLEGEADEVVSLNQKNIRNLEDATQGIKRILRDVDDKDQALALVARITKDFLIDYRQSKLSKGKTGDENNTN